MRFYYLLFMLLLGCNSKTIYQPAKIAIPEQNYPIYDTEKIITHISTGMTKKEVTQILGSPLTLEADKNKECLTYPLTTVQRTEFVLLFENGILTKFNKSQKCVDLFR